MQGFVYSKRSFILTDVSENFRNICLEIYDLDPGKFLSAPRLAWQAALTNTKVELDLLVDIDMLLMIEKVLVEEYVTLVVYMQKLITKT